MTSIQLKYGLSNTTSGNMNKKCQQNKYKQIDLDGFDNIQMLSGQFLQSKTLKKPLKQFNLQFDKTNPQGIIPTNDKTQKKKFQYQINNQVNNQIEEVQDLKSLTKTQKLNYTYLSYNQNDKIKPAYKPLENNFLLETKGKFNKNDKQFQFQDGNTIFSAMMKKGLKNKKNIINLVENQGKNITKIQEKQPLRTIGKAESKLKKLFNKNEQQQKRTSIQQQNIKGYNVTQDIQQDIHQSINQYADQQFQKFSQASGIIKQSIRQSIGYSSAGKHGKSQIIQEIQQSIKNSISASKQQIQQIISSSGHGIKEQINQSLSGSKKSAQEVYEQIYEQYEDQLSKSKSAFKKSSNFKDSGDALSRSFRKKTTVIKSIKLAQEINNISADINKQFNKKSDEDKLADNLIIQKKNLLKKKADIAQLINKKNLPYSVPDKNKNLFYEFKIQINKLLTSQNFETKLRKLTSFINTDSKDMSNNINLLQDKILKNILQQIQKIKKPEIGVNQIQKLKQDYDVKLKTMLKDQQINLRVQMDKKLHEKDMQLKKMIAELQQKFQGKAFASAKVNNFIGQSQNFISNNQVYEMDSDYSIDSDNISWKADLWEILPEYEKKKLYQKQGKQVTNFLTAIMMNQLKEQSLNRSLDISFEFPDDLNSSNEKTSNFPSLKGAKKSFGQSEQFMPKTAFNRKQIQQNIQMPSAHIKQKQSIFPDFQRPKQKPIQNFSFIQKKQNINQYAKVQGQNPIQPTRKDLLIKQKIMQILSKYKSSYLRKKNDVIRKILKIIKPKDSKKAPQQNLLSTVQQITILPKQDINIDQLIYVRAYEQQLIWALIHIMSKNQNKKTSVIQQQMRKNYDRLVVVCQIKTAEGSQQKVTLDLYEQKGYSHLKNNIDLMSKNVCPLEIPFKDQAIQMIQMKQERKVKDQLVQQIIKSLMTEFSKQFPKRKK